jgi:hypothetical protein
MDIKGIVRDGRLYKLSDAAEVLGLQPKALRRKIRNGSMPGVKRGRGVGARYYMTGEQIYEQIEQAMVTKKEGP